MDLVIMYLGGLGSVLAIIGITWSFVLLWRHDKTLFFLAWFLWPISYLVFIFSHWKVAKMNFYMVLFGIALYILGIIPLLNDK